MLELPRVALYGVVPAKHSCCRFLRSFFCKMGLIFVEVLLEAK